MIKNKIFAILMVLITTPVILLDNDLTATVFMLIFAVPIFFGKEDFFRMIRIISTVLFLYVALGIPLFSPLLCNSIKPANVFVAFLVTRLRAIIRCRLLFPSLGT